MVECSTFFSFVRYFGFGMWSVIIIPVYSGKRYNSQLNPQLRIFMRIAAFLPSPPVSSGTMEVKFSALITSIGTHEREPFLKTDSPWDLGVSLHSEGKSRRGSGEKFWRQNIFFSVLVFGFALLINGT